MGFRHLFAIVVLTAAVFMPIGPADADVNAAADEAQFVVLINQLRTSRGLNPLLVDPELVAQARQWSQVMAADNELKHASDLAVGVTANWDVLGENVGVHSIPNLGELFQAFVKSPAHLSNLLDPRFEYVGTGVVYDGHGAIWTTHRFMSVREEVAPPPTTTSTAPPTVPPTTRIPTTQVPATTVTTRLPASPASTPTTSADAVAISSAPTEPAVASTSTPDPSEATTVTPARSSPNALETSTPARATAPVSTGRSEAEAQLDRALISAMIADLDRAGI